MSDETGGIAAPRLIGVAVDGSTLSRKGFDIAMRLRRKDDRIAVLHAYGKPRDDMPAKYRPEFIKSAFETECVARLPAEAWLYAARQKSDMDRPAREELCRLANDTHVDLLVVGTHGRKGPKEKQTILGSTTDFSLRNVHSHTVIVKARPPVPPAESSALFVVAVDGSGAASAAFDLVATAARDGDRVTCLHVRPPQQHRDDDEGGAFEKLRDAYTKRLAGISGAAGGGLTVVVGANLSDAIAEHCAEVEADFLALGVDGMRAFKAGERFLGSVSDTAIRKAPCHVLVADHCDDE